MTTGLKKSALELQSSDQTCDGDGYRFLLDDLERELKSGGSSPMTLDSYLKSDRKNPCAAQLFKNPKTSALAKQVLAQIAGYDEDKSGLSTFDVAYAAYDLYGENFQEDWQRTFLRIDASYSPLQRIRFVGAPLLNPKSPKSLQGKSLTLLRSLAVYVGALPTTEPASRLTPAIDYYFNQKEPSGLADALGVSLKDFLELDDAKKRDLLAKRVSAKFPEAKSVETLFRYLSFAEALSFTRECFKSDARSSLALFEAAALPKLRSISEIPTASSRENLLFPRLAVQTPYPDRQRAIDAFLGTPTLVMKTNIWEAARYGTSTVLKKYLFPGNTEVFSIESKNPGPTTLVFSPHFHEDNPRKVFHWIKDIPLQSGRILLIPEANRAMALQGKDTVRMNRIFDQALNDDEMDYLVTRRTEYLMGLVDGMIGLHDWTGLDAFFISDVNLDAGPLPFPWLPAEVPQIKRITDRNIFLEGTLEGSFKKSDSSGLGDPLQVQWKIADYSARKLQSMTGISFPFRASPIADAKSLRANNATGYMNFLLKKPAMTFEGRKGAEHGRLLAQALYTLLLAYGHRVAPGFEQALASGQPKTDPKIYVGLPPAKPNP